MRMMSAAFADGDWIPRRFTCDGEDVSPRLEWSDPPEHTRSFALVCADPDAPRGVWHHWAVFDIPPEMCELAEAWSPSHRTLRQAINDFGRQGYGGPCPPHGDRPHRYHFTLYALRVDRLDLGARPSCRDVEVCCADALATTTLVGLYGRR